MYLTHKLSRFSRRTMVVAAAITIAAIGFLFSIMQVYAHTDPSNCVSTGVSLSLTVLRADGVTPVGGGTVAPGETIKYQATLSHAGGLNCNYEGGDLDIFTPNSVNNDVDGGTIPLVSSGSPFTGSLATYVVTSSDISGGFLNASAVYTGGTSHLGGNVTPVSATTPASTVFQKLDPGIITHVHNSFHSDITNSSVGQGTSIHDQVTVSAVSTGPMPTGTADFTLHSGLSCQGEVLGTQSNVALVAGAIESDSTTPAAGAYSYSVHYDGDANYNEATALCEPFTINPVLPLVVVKTARTSSERNWNWTINKSADATNLLLTDGQSHTVNYTVDVSAVAATTLAASGTISITNPVGNPAATITGVSDVLSISGAAAVTCTPNTFPFVLPPGSTLSCTYQIVPGTDVSQTNTATVSTSGAVPGGSHTVPVTFGAPTEIDECVDVTDTLAGVLGTVCAGDGDNDQTFNYSKTFGKGLTPAADVVLACGDNTTPNTATYLAVNDANDTAETGSDGHSVNANVACATGCTLTQGYWKTHNASFKGGAPTDDNWNKITSAAQLTGFFTTANSYPVVGPNTSPFSWFSVFWTAPQGNAYYNLAHQYMAAKLNVLNGAVAPGAVTSAITSAEDFFDSYTPASFSALGKKHALRAQVIEWAGILGSFNEGTTGPGHCSEQNPL